MRIDKDTTALVNSHRPLPRLMQWLYQAAASRGDTKADLARSLGVTYGYLNQLSTGLRETRNITSEFCRACAQYLRIPAVSVMVACGRIRPEDFVGPAPRPGSRQALALGLERIAADPLVGGLMPPEAWDAPDAVKALLVALYEDATQQELFAPRPLPLFLQRLQEAAIEVARQDCANDADFLQEQGAQQLESETEAVPEELL